MVGIIYEGIVSWKERYLNKGINCAIQIGIFPTSVRLSQEMKKVLFKIVGQK